MNFGIFITILFIIYETSFYLVIGQAIEKNDCTKLFNYLKGDSIIYERECCIDLTIICDDDGYILSFVK